MNKNFASRASRLSWELFKQTGNIGYYMLYSHIENPPKELTLQDNNSRGMEL